MRSSAALSALIRLCPTNIHITNFYHRVHNRIGLPNSAVMPIDNDTPEKKCYLFLVALTWHFLTFVTVDLVMITISKITRPGKRRC